MRFGIAVLAGLVLCVSCYCSAGVTILVPGDYSTIQGAINAAGNGDTVIVSPGTYTENINMLGKAITLRSTDPLDGNVVLSTIIDGGAAGSVIICNSGESVSTVIDGFLMTNGNAQFGGGMYTDPGWPGSPEVSSSYFCANTPDQVYGAYTDNGGNNFQHCPPPRSLEPEVFGDSDGDGDVDLIDFAAFAENWLEGT